MSSTTLPVCPKTGSTSPSLTVHLCLHTVPGNRECAHLGRGDELGSLTRGKLADIIVVDGNPLLSMRDLRNVVTVVKDGRVFKRPDAGTR